MDIDIGFTYIVADLGIKIIVEKGHTRSVLMSSSITQFAYSKSTMIYESSANSKILQDDASEL